MQQRAIVLFAHGSRDPLWRRPIEAVAERIGALDADALVRCAYLELMEPDLPRAVDGLIAAGATEISVLPMFLGLGRHARQDLPELVAALRLEHPATCFILRPSVGEDPRLVDLMARIALS